MLLVLTYDEKAFRSLDVSISELKNQMKLLADFFLCISVVLYVGVSL